jgi:UDP-N-acetylglucosamine 3-dehydrogenase
MVRIGFVGAGNIGRVYADVISRQLANATVQSVTDIDKDRGEAFAHDYGAKFFPGIGGLLEDPHTDTLAICAPTYLHADLFCRTAAAGKNIFCDKPLALGLADAEKMKDAARRAGIKVMMGHVLRFWPEYVRIKNIIDSGELGRPLHGVAERLCPLPDWFHDTIWYRDEHKSGGAAFDVQIHDLDYLAWLFGKVTLLNCSGVHDAHIGGLRHLCTSVSFASGVSGMVQAGWGLPRSFPFTMVVRVVCERGTIEWIFRSAGSIHKVKGVRRTPISIYHNNGDTSTLSDGFEAIKLVLASVQSLKEKRALVLD